MTVESIIQDRNITDVVHFTTQLGLTGIFHHRQVRAQNLLREDETLQFILRINTQRNMDPSWKGFVNLSISRINLPLLESSQRWHPDVQWRILVFDPMVLTHPNVHFVTTNNAYWQHLERGTGPASLLRLFNQQVAGVYGRPVNRTALMPESWPTDEKAEVLYPTALSTDFLRRIIVPTDEDAESVAGQAATFQHPPVTIDVEPGLFQQSVI